MVGLYGTCVQALFAHFSCLFPTQEYRNQIRDVDQRFYHLCYVIWILIGLGVEATIYR
jgi:hypothetical protein